MDYYSKPVTGCDDCPLCSESCYCGHPDSQGRKDSSIWGEYEPAVMSEGYKPSWCPLRKLPLLLTMKP